MATESCKMQIHKVQRCYLSAKTIDEMNPKESDIISRTDFLRIDCCAKESIDAECKPFCADAGVPQWPALVGQCQHTLRQVQSRKLAFQNSYIYIYNKVYINTYMYNFRLQTVGHQRLVSIVVTETGAAITLVSVIQTAPAEVTAVQTAKWPAEIVSLS